jgi:hypothetical protein
MPYPVYKIIHYAGMFAIFVSLAALCARAAWTIAASADAPAVPGKRLLVVLHGLGLFLVLLGGFGMMSRLGVSHTMLFPAWIWIKLGIWTVAGALVVVPKRRPGWSVPLLVALPLLGALAGAVALYKPFL